MNQVELHNLVHQAGQLLVVQLAAAERSSSRWSDRSIGCELVASAIDACLARLAATKILGQENRLLSGILWESAGQLLETSALVSHARFKPRGYAGDFLMLERICHSWQCDHPLGGIIDQYFQSQAAPQAVRNRTQLIADLLWETRLTSHSQKFHAASFGSGPGIDFGYALERLPASLRGNFHVLLLDLDPDAIDQSQNRLACYLSPAQIVARRENLTRFFRSQARVAEQPLDFIACSGFMDYLEDGEATALLEFFWRSLAPGGRLLVFNFAPHNPSRPLMEWIGNWYLRYRDTESMRRLASAAGIPESTFQIRAEELGVNLYIDATKLS